MSLDNKVRGAKNHGKNFQGELVPSFNGIAYWEAGVICQGGPDQ